MIKVSIVDEIRFKKRLKQEKKFYFEQGIFAYKMPVSRSVDIDTLVDFRFAESLLNN